MTVQVHVVPLLALKRGMEDRGQDALFTAEQENVTFLNFTILG